MTAGSTYDFVVVGGGHNGLIAANYLARAGSSVLVLELRPYLGGMAASRPHVAAAPEHVLSKGAIDAVFIQTTSIIEDLGLAQHGLRLMPIDPGYGWLSDDGETLGIFRDATRTSDDIARFSKTDARTYLDLQNAFATLLDLQLAIFSKAATSIGPIDLAKSAMRLIGDRSARKILGRLLAASAHEAIASTFESDPLRSLFAYWTEIACPADIDGSGLHLASLALIHRVGCSRPVGSMGAFVASLERGLLARGGSVRLDADVDRILVERGRACGVVLGDGERVAARRGVLASCPPQVTYGRLLATDQQSPNSRARLPFMPANASNMCPFKVDVAVGGKLSFEKAQRRRASLDGLDVGATSWMTGTFVDHLAHGAALRQGRMGPKPPIWMTVLSHADPSIAPPGQAVAYLYTSTPSTIEGGWEDGAPRVAGDLLSQASNHLHGLEAEIGRCVTGPMDFEGQYGTPRGCLYHVDMLPTRLGLARPAVGMGGARSEVSGLFLAGSGSHPGGGVFGMPGKLAAEDALRD